MNKLNREAESFFAKNKSKAYEEVLEASSLLKLEESRGGDVVSILFSESDSESNEKLDMIGHLTDQIRSVQKQGVLLIGEKIFKVREILKDIGKLETTFSRWIDLVFPTKSSAYNALAYYELYISLPTQSLKNKFQSIPFKSAYIISSRRVSLNKKIQTIDAVQGMGNDVAREIINKMIPSQKPFCKSDYKDCLDYLIYKKSYELIHLLKKSKSLSNLSRRALKDISVLFRKF